MSRVRDVVEVLARALALQPDEVSVSETQRRSGTLIELHTAQGELGRVIGRQGRTANAIRAIASAVAEREGTEATVEFRDGQPAPDR